MSEQPIARKPSWLRQDAFEELLRRCGGVPRCVVSGETEDLTIDHIVPRWAGGTDDVGNLQFMARRLNVKKGIRPDSYWSQRFYWDRTPNLDGFRGAQQLLFQEIGDRGDWFGRPMGEIARHLYVNAWIVGGGKTLGIAAGAWAVNRVVRERWGAARRADRVLVVTKERAVRDQIVEDLRQDITRYGIDSEAPRVGVIEHGWQLEQTVWLDEQDAVVTCVHQLWERRDGEPRANLAEILARFPVIAFDEPHYATDQVTRLVDAATTSICLGFTGTPIDALGTPLLGRMVALTVYDYGQASNIDHGLKWLDGRPELADEFVHEISITEAELIERGERTTTQDASKDGYGKNIEPAKSVVRWLIDETVRRDQLVVSAERLAPHRDREKTEKAGVYPAHPLIVCGDVATAKALCKNINELFERDPVTYPSSQGWRAEVVHTDTEDEHGRRIAGQPLNLNHPWLRAKKQGNQLDAKCARLLFVVGIGREGVNNPLCGPVGIATAQASIVEVIQRGLGRQLRAVVSVRDGKLLAPPEPLDKVLIITHKAFGNTGLIRRAIDFVCEMGDQLAKLPRIEDLDAGDLRPPEEIERDVLLPTREKIDVAGRLSAIDGTDNPPSIDDVVAEFAGIDTGRRVERIRDWVTKVREAPESARKELRLDREIEPNLIVTREQVKYEPSDADLERYLQIHQPDLIAEYLPLVPITRRLIERMYVQHARQFHLPPLTSGDDINAIRLRMAASVRRNLGRHLTGEVQAVYKLVGRAVQLKLGAPDGEALRIGSDWDSPPVHALLNRTDVQAEIVGWVIGRLIDKGFCPALVALRGSQDGA